jgi:putative Ca2+/H+ antiporter (TMEM165/GDT1 family)
MEAFLVAAIFIGVSELGEKNQLLTFDCAKRSPLWLVVLAVVLASALLQALAVVFGSFLAVAIEPVYVNLIVGALFVAFGIWALLPRRGAEEITKGNLPAFLSVFIAFFLAELGDKSQLATAALAMNFNEPFPIFWGAFLGMVVVNVIGVFAGSWIKSKVAEKTLNLVAAALFVLYGILTIMQPLLK